MLAQLICSWLGRFILFEKMKSYFMRTFVVHNWNWKNIYLMWLWQNFENWMKLATFLQKLQNDDFERDEADAYLWTAGPLNVKKKGMIICYVMNRCLVMLLRRRKVNVQEYWNVVAKLKVNKWSLSKWLSN